MDNKKYCLARYQTRDRKVYKCDFIDLKFGQQWLTILKHKALKHSAREVLAIAPDSNWFIETV